MASSDRLIMALVSQRIQERQCCFEIVLAVTLAMISRILLTASAMIVLVLGFIHLAFTFFTRKLSPRDEELEKLMRQVSPRLTRQITMWKGWIAFNTTHSLGIIFFGVIYVYLALFAWTLLVHSPFFVVVGIAFFASNLVVAKKYMFSSPRRHVALAASLYVLGVVIAIVK